MDSARRFQALYVVFFASFSGLVVYRSVFLQDIGMTGTEIGLIGSLWVAGGVVAQPLWGFVADYTQSPTRVLWAAAVSSGIVVLSYPLGAGLPAYSFLVVAAGTVVYSATRAPIVPIANSLVLGAGYEYGRMRSFGSTAFGLAVLIVGYALVWFQTTLIIYVYVVGMIVFVTLLHGVSGGTAQLLEGHIVGNLSALFRESEFRLTITTAFVMGMVSSPGSGFFAVYVRVVGFGDSITGVVWLFKTIAEAAVFLAVTRRAGSYAWPVVLGGMGYVAAFWFLATWPSLPTVVVANLFLGAGYALLSVSLVNLAHRSAPTGMDSSAQTILASVGMGAGGAVGQGGAGYLVDLVGVQEMYAALAGGASLIVAFGLLLSRRFRS